MLWTAETLQRQEGNRHRPLCPLAPGVVDVELESAFALFCESGKYFYNWPVTCVTPLCCPRLGFLRVGPSCSLPTEPCGTSDAVEQDECLLVTVRPFTLLFIAWFECYTSPGTEAD